jgi:hypothetical protein
VAVVVEHVFITTMEAHEAMLAALAMLQSHGFSASAAARAFEVAAPGQTAPPVWDQLEVTRGNKKIARAKSVADLPQSVRLEWDRGRVTVAASIASVLPGRSGGSFAFSAEGVQTKKLNRHVDLMTSLATSLEALLARREPLEQARITWDAAEARMAEDLHRRRRNGAIAGIVALVIIGTLVSILIWALSR